MHPRSREMHNATEVQLGPRWRLNMLRNVQNLQKYQVVATEGAIA
jgi:hypothetical protein